MLASRYSYSHCHHIFNPLTAIQAEFLYKVKPKLPNQFKAADNNGVPFAVVLGEDEVAQGKVKIKEMGLRDGHPEKEGVLVNLSDLVEEVKHRIRRKAELDSMTQHAEGLKVVGGVKGEPEKETDPNIGTEAKELQSTDTIGAVPAS
jgi:histidyl-tRNA synthetase